MSPLGKTTDLLEELRSLDLTVLANDSNERNKALALSRKLTASLENPTERALDYIYKVCSKFWSTARQIINTMIAVRHHCT